jgi:hypothetical protein
MAADLVGARLLLRYQLSIERAKRFLRTTASMKLRSCPLTRLRSCARQIKWLLFQTSDIYFERSYEGSEARSGGARRVARSGAKVRKLNGER